MIEYFCEPLDGATRLCARLTVGAELTVSYEMSTFAFDALRIPLLDFLDALFRLAKERGLLSGQTVAVRRLP